jgi:flavorubredoxin
MGRGLAGDGVSVKLFDLRYNHRSDVMTEVLTARALILGSPVLNKTILPKMADMLSYMKALKPFNKIGSAFGSYGWSDTSTKQLIQALEDLKIEVVDSGISSHYVPDTNVLDECEKFGERMKAEILKRGFEG